MKISPQDCLANARRLANYAKAVPALSDVLLKAAEEWLNLSYRLEREERDEVQGDDV